MATTTYGTPYVTSADLVSNWPAASLTVANSVDAAGYYIGRGLNAQTASYTLVLTDAGKTVTMTVGTANVLNIPTNASVAFPTGTRVNVINLGAGATTVTALAGVTINGTVVALATNSAASIIKTATNTWSYVPFSSGVGNAVYSDANTGTYTGYAYKTFSSSGTITVTTAGFADIVVLGGGGGGGKWYGGGGGAGGVLVVTAAYLPVGTLTVTVGAGGAGGPARPADGGAPGLPGITSRINSYYAVGGGGGGSLVWAASGSTFGLEGYAGGSGGGGQFANLAGGTATSGQGNAGGVGGSLQGSGGGGGGGAVGASGGASTTGGAGGAGTTTAIAGTTPTGAYVAGNYSMAGGGGGSGTGAAGAGGSGGGGAGSATNPATAGSVNTGGGGGATGTTSAVTFGASGGSGIVIVRVGV